MLFITYFIIFIYIYYMFHITNVLICGNFMNKFKIEIDKCWKNITTDG